MLTPSSVECSYGVKKIALVVGWVGECCSELGTRIAIP